MTAPPKPSPWAHLRALWLLLHILVVSFMALPAPDGGMNRKAWADPTVQAEFDAWRQRLGGLGLELSAEELEDQLWTFATAYTDLRDAVLEPLDPYLHHLGTRQSWRMFVAPHRHPAKLVVAVRTDGIWEEVYRSRDPERSWRGAQLDHTRTRSAIFRYAWRHYRSSYSQFADWLARHAAVDFPEAQRLRVYWWRYQTLNPERAAAGEEPEGKVERPLERDLDELRAASASPTSGDGASP